MHAAFLIKYNDTDILIASHIVCITVNDFQLMCSHIATLGQYSAEEDIVAVGRWL